MNYQDYGIQDPTLRPAEPDMLGGNPSKAKVMMRLETQSSFEELVKLMSETEIKIIHTTQSKPVT